MKTIRFIMIIVASVAIASSCERSFDPVKKAEKIINKYDDADEIADGYYNSEWDMGSIDKQTGYRYYLELENINRSFMAVGTNNLDYTNICDLLVDLYLGYYYKNGMNVNFNVHTYDDITWDIWEDIIYIDNKYVDSDYRLHDETVHDIMSSLSGIAYDLVKIPENSRSEEVDKIIDLSFKITKENTDYMDGGTISYVYLGELFTAFTETMSVIAGKAAVYYDDALKYLAWSKSDFYYGSRDFDIINERRNQLIEYINETANRKLGSNAFYFDGNLKWILNCKENLERIAEQKRLDKQADALMALGILGLF